MTITRSPYISNPDILFCHEARSTRPVALDFGEADMLPAGTLISCEGKAVNDLTALGVLLYDTWKGYGSGQGVVLISGHVDLAKAQEHSGLTYSSEAKAALKGICFVGDGLIPVGVMRVNVTYESMDQSMTFDGIQADKTYTEIKNHLDNGGFAYAFMSITGMGDVYVPVMTTGTHEIGTGSENTLIFAAVLNMGTIYIHVGDLYTRIFIQM